MDDDKPTTAELSLPIAFDGYYFTDFGKRIVLIQPGSGTGGLVRKADDSSGGGGDDAVEVVDIEIRRK